MRIVSANLLNNFRNIRHCPPVTVENLQADQTLEK